MTTVPLNERASIQDALERMYLKGYEKGQEDFAEMLRKEIEETQASMHEFGWVYEEVLEFIDKHTSRKE